MIEGQITATISTEIKDGYINVTPWSNGSGEGKMWFDVKQARAFAEHLLTLASDLEDCQTGQCTSFCGNCGGE